MVHELMVRMRERDYNVWGEIYPYAAGSTALNAVFLEPEVWVKALGNKYEDTLQDVATGEFYTQKSRRKCSKKNPSRPVLVYKIPESAIVDWIKLPGVAIGSDGMPMIPDDNLTWDTPLRRSAQHPSAYFRVFCHSASPCQGKQYSADAGRIHDQLQLCKAAGRDGFEVHAGTRPYAGRHGGRHHHIRS